MKRRTFLTCGWAAGAVGAVGYRTFKPPKRRLEIGVWPTERVAATYGEGCSAGVVPYLERSFGEAFDQVEVKVGAPVAVGTENPYRVTASGEWPSKVLRGYAQNGGVHPAADVNLLLTDGDIHDGPSGMGGHGVASVGGASYLARLPPVERLDDPAAYAVPVWVVQVVLHECGHALGLRHNDGSIRETAEVVVVSPMVSTYPWASPAARKRYFDYEQNVCGKVYPSVAGKRRYLSLSFSSCARRALRRYNGGPLV